MWMARDQSGQIWIFNHLPVRMEDPRTKEGVWACNHNNAAKIRVGPSCFNATKFIGIFLPITWEDEPIEVEFKAKELQDGHI